MLPYINASSLLAQANVVWSPQKGSQEIFLDCPVREALFSGNRGGGKTDCLIMDFAQHVGQGFGADWVGILFRETYPQLADVIKKTQKWFPRIWPKAVFNKSEKTWTWPSGEQLLLRHMGDPEDYWNYHGHAYPWQGWEELCNWKNDECFTRMMSCCRSTNKEIPRKIRATTNPYGPGHNWVKKRYQLPQMFGKIIRTEGEHDRVAIHSSVLENKILLDSDPDYLQTIKGAARNEQELRAWLHGDWDIVAGGAFDDLWDKRIVVPRFVVPDNWYVDRSFDMGSSAPFSVGWWAEANGEEVELPDGRIFCPAPGSLIRINEWYGSKDKDFGENIGLRIGSVEIAEGILIREEAMRAQGWISGDVAAGPADNSIADVADSSKESTEKLMADQGVLWTTSNKTRGSRVIGVELMRERMRATATKDKPAIYIMDNCKAACYFIPSLPRCDKNPDDVNSDVEDHIWDEIRYKMLAGVGRDATELGVHRPH